MPDESMSAITHENDEEPETLSRRTSCNLSGVDDEWDIEAMDCGDELKDAIQAVRENHDESRIVETDTVWILRAYWNDNTDSVWVGAFGYYGGFEAMGGDDE